MGGELGEEGKSNRVCYAWSDRDGSDTYMSDRDKRDRDKNCRNESDKFTPRISVTRMQQLYEETAAFSSFLER